MKFIRKKLLLILSAIVILSCVIPVYTNAATERRSFTVKYIYTTEEGAGACKTHTYTKGSAGWNAVFERVKSVYGEKAEELYLQGIATGDYYAYRSYVGVWVPSCEDPNLYPFETNGTTLTKNDFQFLCDESSIYNAYGKYGTIDYYLADMKSKGWDGTGNPVIWEFMNNVSASKLTSYPGSTTSTASTASSSAIEALKTYSGNNSEFNAYNYYNRYADLQAAFGADGDKLLQHYNQYGKAEGRNAK
ncbi:hypothetical protein [Butyrivibrio sp.]|uniref:hypothetical protein n=1 Tax=Butyrivibrio sp. TaxID=28121 RepID=UPI0025B7EB05|nr:hypothetical protein [Butyrivibrio sp.]MBQ9302484.1 hypothetical protein [Butyrivibrio sp.]